MALGVHTGATDKRAVHGLADGQEEKRRQTHYAEILLSSCTYQCRMRDLFVLTASCWDVGGIIALPHRIYIVVRCGWYHYPSTPNHSGPSGETVTCYGVGDIIPFHTLINRLQSIGSHVQIILYIRLSIIDMVQQCTNKAFTFDSTKNLGQ